jgi:hypothetical protein
MRTGRKYYRAGIDSPSMRKLFESITQEDGKILRDELDRQNRRIRRAEVRAEYKDRLLKEELHSRGSH